MVVVVVNATAEDGGGSPKDRADDVVVGASVKDGVDETAIGFIPKLNDGAELVGAGNVNPVEDVAGFDVDVKEKADPGAKEPTVDCGNFGAKLVTVLGTAAVGFGANKPVPVVAAGVVTPNPPKAAEDGNAVEPLKNPPNDDGVVVLAAGVGCEERLNPPSEVGAEVVVTAGVPPNDDGTCEAPNKNPPVGANFF